MLDIRQKGYLLKLAREVILARLEKREISIELDRKGIFSKKVGAFVTLKIDDELRGCIGYIEAFKPLIETIVDMAEAAAFQDPRFYPLQKKEFSDLVIEISIISELQEVTSIEDIKIGRDGLLIRNKFKSGLLLPQVPVEWNWDRKEFLQQTCRKAGLDKDDWKLIDNKLLKFSAEIFSERKEKRI